MARCAGSASTTCDALARGVVGRLERLGIEYDTSLGFSDRPGPRAGFSFPFRPWDHGPRGRPRFLELPLLLMDATLAESRYMGLSPSKGRKEVDGVLDRLAAVGGGAAILWHTDRFDRVYGRGWGGVYEHLLDGIVARAARPGRAPRSATGGRPSAARPDRQLLLPARRRRGSATGAQALPPPCRLGVEVDVLAPDDPRFSAQDPELLAAIPASTTVHRARLPRALR